MEHLIANKFIQRAKDADSSEVFWADLDDGWTEEQAKGLLDSFKLVGAVPNWKAEHLLKLYHWCVDHQTDQKTIEGQLEFIAYELCNSYAGIGMALKQARTVEEAREAVEPYVKLLRSNSGSLATFTAIRRASS
jgi:hypothetical protein